MRAIYQHKRILLLTSCGGLLEFYDFIISALFASYIAQVFFPNESTLNGLLAAFSIYAVGYLARPLGGIIFGHFGDKYGRKKTFTLSILIMGAATFAIGLIPSYAQIGILAPILLILFKVLQGLAVGGEIPGAITYVSEFIPQHKAVAISVIFLFLFFGICLGYLVQALLINLYTEAEIINWGWRLPFLLGGVFAVICYYLRTKLTEIPQFVPYINPKQPFPGLKVIKDHGWVLLQACIVVSLGGMLLPGLFLFLPSYLNQILHYSFNNMIWICILSLILSTLFGMLTGWLSDKGQRMTLFYYFALAVVIFIIPIFIIYVHFIELYPLALGISALLIGLSMGNVPALLAELFPANVRYSGLGLSYNIGGAAMGGVTPLLLISGIKLLNDPMAPAYILLLVALLVLCSLILLKRLKKI